MTLFSHRKYCYALLLVMLIGSVELSFHSISHITTDLATCEVCNGHSNPVFVMHDGNHRAPSAAPVQKAPANTSHLTATNTHFTLHESRAPPAIS